MRATFYKYLIIALTYGLTACSEADRTNVTSRQLTDDAEPSGKVCIITAKGGASLYRSFSLAPEMQPSLTTIDRGVVVDLIHDEYPNFGFSGAKGHAHWGHVSNRTGESFSGSDLNEGYVELVDSMGTKHAECVHLSPCAIRKKIPLDFRHVQGNKGYIRLKYDNNEFTTCPLSPLRPSDEWRCTIKAEYGLLTLRKGPGTDKAIVTDGNGNKIYLADSYGPLQVLDVAEVETGTWHKVKWYTSIGWIATTYNGSIYADCTVKPASTDDAVDA